MDEYGKKLYDKLEANIDNMKSGTYCVDYGTEFDELLHEENGEEVLSNAFQLAINSLNFDNPDLFYLDISKMYLLTTITTKFILGTEYTVKIGPNNGVSYLNSEFATINDVNIAIQNVNNKKQEIISKLSGSVENQIKGVHNYLIDNVSYNTDFSNTNRYNVYGTLVDGSAVCEGYARAFKSIMDDLNISCIMACGTAINSKNSTENHAWNYVRLDNQWYAIDCTWDDPVIVGSGYLSPLTNYKYYLKGSKTFFTNHFQDGNIVGNSNFQYPTLSEKDY